MVEKTENCFRELKDFFFSPLNFGDFPSQDPSFPKPNLQVKLE